ncbi:ATP-binding protein [Thiomicrospira aerophila AL3]|uniref:ATP-binding protein n=1 Tax=Thiomicrospira aerophila AL3 TaxID=717772 RepID=W0DVQ2_9GAMM|nr:DUF2062 domain-containing protein [Thiomicrospira aerophila]AHF00956.1 ATP-binding protein [Thiomicrospira aerophila AL3]
MAKKLFKKWTPHPGKLLEKPGLARIAHWVQEPNLWHLNRSSVAKAFFIGPFWAAMPMPWQMLVAAISAIGLKANLTLSILLVWISNPITMGPIWYFNYWLGSVLLGEAAKENLAFEMSWAWIGHTFVAIWQPLMLGSLVVGVSAGTLGYLLVQLGWQLQVRLSWRSRQRRREEQTGYKKPRG